MWRWIPAACLMAAGTLQADPLEEARALLLRLHPDRQGAVEALSGETDLLSAVRRIDPWARLEEPAAEAGPAGIGAELLARGGRLWLVPLAGGPLFRAGVRRRAVLLAVDGRPVKERETAAALLRGRPGTPVCLELERDGRWQKLCLERALRPAPAVELLGPGLFRVRAFRPRETVAALEALLSDPGGEVLVLDLTECTGGELYEALDAAGLFLPPGAPLARLVHLEEGRAEAVSVPAALPTWRGVLLLLVGPDTASACEIFAGALRHHRRAALNGGPTRGKCSAQRAFVLSDGRRLWLTDLQVRFPDGGSCEGVGVGGVGAAPDWVRHGNGSRTGVRTTKEERER